LRASVAAHDVVVRMGGDEFVIVMPEFRDQKDAERCAEAIIQKVATPMTLGNREVNVTVSVGISNEPNRAAVHAASRMAGSFTRSTCNSRPPAAIKIEERMAQAARNRRNISCQ